MEHMHNSRKQSLNYQISYFYYARIKVRSPLSYSPKSSAHKSGLWMEDHLIKAFDVGLDKVLKVISVDDRKVGTMSGDYG